jgi:hypothetical protein
MGMRVRLTQIDGKLPNLALMRLGSWHRARGDEVVFTRRAARDLFEGDYDRVYGSAIFTMSHPAIGRLLADFPDAIVGGTGIGNSMVIEEITVEYEDCDYSFYPDFKPSIGFTARGCRLKCKFCVVPTKEGKPKPANTIHDIWRGQGHPKNIHLLDNDFFGQGRENWTARISEIISGGFKVCLNQGINVRLIDDEAAEALASIEYRNDAFNERVLYTAWDNLKDEEIFFRGVDRLERAGVPPRHLMAYMLVGFDKSETWERIFHRFDRMVERGIRPYPMVYDPSRKDLKAFQRWVVTGLYRAVRFEDYNPSASRKIGAAGPDLISWSAS